MSTKGDDTKWYEISLYTYIYIYIYTCIYNIYLYILVMLSNLFELFRIELSAKSAKDSNSIRNESDKIFKN